MLVFNDAPEPREPCPKCTAKGDRAVNYHETAHESPYSASFPPTRSEHICWTCTNCGYAVETLCADAKVEAVA